MTITLLPLLTAAATMLARSTTFLWNFSIIGNFHAPPSLYFHWSLRVNSAFLSIFDFRSLMLCGCNQHGERKDSAQATFYMPLRENNTSLPVHRFCLALSTTKKQPCSCRKNQASNDSNSGQQKLSIKSAATGNVQINGEEAAPSDRRHPSLVNTGRKHQRCIVSSNALNLSQGNVPLE